MLHSAVCRECFRGTIDARDSFAPVSLAMGEELAVIYDSILKQGGA